MPLYEYHCANCNLKFENLTNMALRATIVCPECGRAATKLMSTCNWSFGWRISDRSMNVPWTPRDELVRDI